MADNPLIERPRPGVLRITINDPERRNPLSSDLFGKIESALRDLDGDVRIVVLTGAGDKVFAPGADLSELGGGDGAPVTVRLSAEAHGSHDVREGLSAFFERREPIFRGQ